MFQTIAAIIIGILFIISIFNLVLILKQIEVKKNLSLLIIGIFCITYYILKIVYYNTITTDASLLLNKLCDSFLFLSAIAFIWYMYFHTKDENKLIPGYLTVGYAVLYILTFLLPNGVMYAKIDGIRESFNLGGEVYYEHFGTPGIVGYIVLLHTLLTFTYLLYISLKLRNSNGYGYGSSFYYMGIFALIFAAITIDYLVYNFAEEFVYAGMTILMGLRLVKDLGKAGETRNELNRTNKLLSSFYEHSPLAVTQLDPEGSFIFANKAARKMSGYSVEEMHGKKFYSICHPEDKERIVRNNIRMMKGQINSDTDEYRFIHKNGKVKYLHINSSVVRDEFGNTEYIISFSEDITEKKKLELQLSERETIFAQLFNNINSGVAVYEFDIAKNDFVFIDMNKAGEKLSSVKKTDIIGKPVTIVFPGIKEMGLFDVFHKVYESGIPDHLPFTSYEDSRVIMWVENYVFKLPSGQIVALYNDISEQKRSEHALIESERILKRTQEAAHLGSWEYHPETGKTYWSDELYQIFGFSPATVTPGIELGMSVIHPEDREKTEDAIKSTINKGIPYNIEIRIIRSNGELRYVKSTGELTLTNGGRSKKLLGSYLDITESKNAELLLRENEERYRMLASATSEAVFISNNGVFIDVNEVAGKMFGYEYDEIVGHKGIEFVTPEYKGIVNNNMLRQYEKPYEVNGLKKDGTIFPILLWGRMFKYKGALRRLTICRDLTQQKEYEKALIEAKEKAELSDRLKSEFMAQVSHEIRTPVGAILSFSQLLNSIFESDDQDVIEVFEGIESSGKRLIRTINLILNVSEIQTDSYDFVKKRLNLFNDILLPLQKEFKYQAELKGLEFSVNCPEDIIVETDEYSTTQVFANLVDNAIKYTEKGHVKLIVLNDACGNVQVDVADSGIGISEEYMPELFKPFTQEEHGYTRKFEGTGLGLTLVMEYCKMNDLDLSVKSSKGKGTTFSVVFKNSRYKSIS